MSDFDLVAVPVKQPRKTIRNTSSSSVSTTAPAPVAPRPASNLVKLDRSVSYPVLSGRYEVILPDRDGKIYFTDSLAVAAEKVASARYSNPAKVKEILDFLEGVQRMGGLAAGEYGVRVHRNYDDGSPWIAKVRGAQQRDAPKFHIGEQVELVEPIGHQRGNTLVRINNIVVLNDLRVGKQYGYTVETGGGGHLLTEGRLRGATEVPGVLDFDQLPA